MSPLRVADYQDLSDRRHQQMVVVISVNIFSIISPTDL